MKRTALVLAAHGSRVDPAVNEHLCALAIRVESMRMFDEVTPAFHHGTPTFATVLDGLSAENVIVVPAMTSAGYYCDEVLTRELRKNARFGDFRVHQTPPVGTHSRMAAWVGARAEWLAGEFGMGPDRATLALVGHGTARNPRSRLATEQLAVALSKPRVWAQVLTAFMDEQPEVETILSRAIQVNVLVIPFLIGAGTHATMDIPTRLGVSPDGIQPFERPIAGRRVVCDRAMGADDGLLDSIVELATQGLSNIECRLSNRAQRESSGVAG